MVCADPCGIGGHATAFFLVATIAYGLVGHLSIVYGNWELCLADVVVSWDPSDLCFEFAAYWVWGFACLEDVKWSVDRAGTCVEGECNCGSPRVLRCSVEVGPLSLETADVSVLVGEWAGPLLWEAAMMTCLVHCVIYA